MTFGSTLCLSDRHISLLILGDIITGGTIPSGCVLNSIGSKRTLLVEESPSLAIFPEVPTMPSWPFPPGWTYRPSGSLWASYQYLPFDLFSHNKSKVHTIINKTTQWILQHINTLRITASTKLKHTIFILKNGAYQVVSALHWNFPTYTKFASAHSAIYHVSHRLYIEIVKEIDKNNQQLTRKA